MSNQTFRTCLCIDSAIVFRAEIAQFSKTGLASSVMVTCPRMYSGSWSAAVLGIWNLDFRLRVLEFARQRN